MSGGALAGLRVLELDGHLPAQLAAMYLGDFGADVVKVTPPRAARPRRPPVERRARVLDRNKRALALDLKTADGRHAFYRLIDTADVLIECFRPGTAARLGADYATLAARQPRLVYCSLSGYGQSGPYRDLPGHDVNYLAFAGALLPRREGEPPTVQPHMLADLLGAQQVISGVLLALVARAASGLGQHVDVALHDAALSLMAGLAPELLSAAVPPAHTAAVTTSGDAVPCYGIYPAADGHVSLGALEEWTWANFCRAVEREDLIPAQYATGAEGERVREELRALFRTRSRADWFALLAAREVSCTPLRTLAEALADPATAARGMAPLVDDPRHGPLRQVGAAPRLGGTPAQPPRPAPALGQDTTTILAELGYDAAEIAALIAAGIAHQSEPPGVHQDGDATR
jgi:alpha-methylacyl-CoA racemase